MFHEDYDAPLFHIDKWTIHADGSLTLVTSDNKPPISVDYLKYIRNNILTLKDNKLLKVLYGII